MRCIALLFAVVAAAASAQDWPSRPVHIVVPYTPGVGADTLARVLGPKLSARWNTPVIVDNKPGATGNIGADQVAKAPPDGNTFLLAATSLSANPAYKPAPFDPVRDFTPVALLATGALGLYVNPELPAKTTREFIELARSRPGKLYYSSPGNGGVQHLSMELFKLETGIDIVHVPYKGVTQALPDIMNGQIALMFDNIVGVLPRVKAGQEKAIAVTSLKRSPLAPNIPTVSESGLPGYESETYFGIFAPAGTPEAVVTKLSQDLAQVLKRPDLKELLATQGAEAVGSDPAKLAAVVRADTAKWEKVIKAAGVKLE